jgi:hypothetical protein
MKPLATSTVIGVAADVILRKIVEEITVGVLGLDDHANIRSGFA